MRETSEYERIREIWRQIYEASFLKGRCLVIQKNFCAVYYYVGDGDLSKGYRNPKRKLGVTTHFCFRDN